MLWGRRPAKGVSAQSRCAGMGEGVHLSIMLACLCNFLPRLPAISSLLSSGLWLQMEVEATSGGMEGILVPGGHSRWAAEADLAQEGRVTLRCTPTATPSLLGTRADDHLPNHVRVHWQSYARLQPQSCPPEPTGMAWGTAASTPPPT